ncbi:hypothetical protein, partial [Burkholderia cenocepacia]|uniref:hypothetical protein n=1 Tax=Burkholderia cenocepacia TaxID=95486 RepID=UPI0038CBF52E
AQVDGTAGVPIPLPTPFGVVGLEAIGGAPTPLAVIGWLAALAAIVVLAWRQRASIDGAWVLGLVAVVIACAGGLAVVYGIDGYSTGKWLGIVVPIVVPPVVAWMAAAVADRDDRATVGERLATVVVGGVLVVVPAVAASAFAAVHIVLPPTTLDLASSQALADEPVVNVDLESRHSAGLVPLLVPAEAVVSMDVTYAHASDPIGDVFLVDADASTVRDWTEQVDMPSSLVLGSLDLDASAGGVSLLTAGGSDHLFGGWVDTRPERTQLTADTEPGIVVLDVAGSPAAIVVTGFVDGPTRVEIAVGDPATSST